MNEQKRAAASHPIHALIAERWSPYSFADRPVSDDDVRSLFEAARWTASSYNEQPWSYLVATKAQPEAFAKLLGCLVEPNRVWAAAAPVLVLGCMSLTFARNGQPNPAAPHDLGGAGASLTLEATARGLSVHQMIGILPDVARSQFSIPEGVQPLTALAIGYVADPIPEALRGRDSSPRSRKALAEFVFADAWGTASKIVG